MTTGNKFHPATRHRNVGEAYFGQSRIQPCDHVLGDASGQEVTGWRAVSCLAPIRKDTPSGSTGHVVVRYLR
jgi:hypothetical protein